MRSRPAAAPFLAKARLAAAIKRALLRSPSERGRRVDLRPDSCCTSGDANYKQAYVRKLFDRLDDWFVWRIWSHRHRKWRCSGCKTLPCCKLYRKYRLVNSGAGPHTARRKAEEEQAHLARSMLRIAFYALKRDAAPVVHDLTWRDHEADLDRRIEDLHARVQRGACRAQPSRRRFIPKADGR